MNQLISPKNLLSTASEHPENLLLFPMDVLKMGLTRPNRPEIKAAILAELFVRHYLSGDNKLNELIDQYLVHGESSRFDILMPFTERGHCDVAALFRQLWIPEPGDDLSRFCLDALRERFQFLLRADGMIPVILEGGADSQDETAFLLPFYFEEDGEDVGVFDIHGKELLNAQGNGEWSRHLKHLKIRAKVRVLCSGVDGLPFGGDSMMLPVQMAWWRKEGFSNWFNAYDPFQLVATGAFDDRELLKRVKIGAKAKAVMDSLYKATFVYPDNGEGVSGKHVLPLPENMTKDMIREKLLDFIEKTTSWPQEYAIRRMKSLSFEVRAWNISDWEILIQKIKNGAEIGKSEHPMEYLVFQMFLSEAYCHFGRTEEAKRYNERARGFAREHGTDFQELLLRLEIEQLVLYQDEEDFEKILELAPDLSDRLLNLGDTDLLMRYHGTMGQAQMFGTLAGIKGFSRQKGLENIEQAIHFAVQNKVDHDIAQDLNYKYLFYVLFMPGSEEEKSARQEAVHKVEELRYQQNPAYEKNRRFLMRFQTFSWYRQLLLTGKMPIVQESVEMKRILLDKSGKEDWLGCMVSKYLGALKAASGEIRQAEKWFQKAFQLIPSEQKNGILLLIKLTAYAEAYRSLRDEKYRLLGLELSKCINAPYLQTTLGKWQKYLTYPDSEFPGLAYWY